MSLRVIEGGRTDARHRRPARRRGERHRDAGRRAPAGPRSGRYRDAARGRRRGRPGGARWRRSSPRGATGSRRSDRRREVERALEAAGLPLSRFARIDASGGLVTPGPGRPAHAPAVRRQPRGRADAPPAGRRLSRDPRRRRRDPVDGRRDPRRRRVDELLAHGRRWLDEMLRHGVTTIEAKSGYGLDLRTELRLLEVAHQLGQEGPIDILPTWLGAHAVPMEFRDRRDPAEAYTRHLLDEQLAGVAAQGRARFADVFCERGVFSPDQSRADPGGGRGVRDAAAAPRRRAGAVRRCGACRRDRRAVGGPPRGPVGGGDRRPCRRPPDPVDRSSRSSSPRRPGS